MLDALLAPRCAGCDAPGAWLCHDCRDLCDPVRRGRLHAAGTFGGPLRRAIHRFKYQGERALANELGALVAGCVARDLARGVALDVVAPAVMHPERARLRGYDQAALLAAEVASRTALPLRAFLRRVRLAQPQAQLDRAARVANMRNAFVAEAASPTLASLAKPGPLPRGLRVALVDDVATTGATLTAAAGALRAAGAREVRFYVVAFDE